MRGLIVGIRYLADYAAASDPADRQRVEWPPHPARVFMAMAAAHFEAGGEAGERDALEWLQAQPRPVILADEASERSVVKSYVPVNDQAIGKNPGPLQCIAGWPRSKQPRTFPRAWLTNPEVYLIWPDADPDRYRDSLENICVKVTRIGHSSSLVQMWVGDKLPQDAPDQRWEPVDTNAEKPLRVPSEGLLSRLESDYKAGQRPTIGFWQGYSRQRPESRSTVPETTWDPRLVVRSLVAASSRHPRLDLVAASRLTQALHESIICRSEEPVPEFISGHRPDGSPSEMPHIAHLPLAFVGSQHATGQVMGIAMALPRGLSRSQRFQALAALGRLRELRLGSLGEWHLQDADASKVNLRDVTWTADSHGARVWGSVTPVAFDRHAKAKDRAGREDELAEMIRLCCERIGLPNPAQVTITPVSVHLGVPSAYEFPRLKRKDGTQRRHAHVILAFEEPVRGPVALGAGRYRGYGFCRPHYGEEAL